MIILLSFDISDIFANFANRSNPYAWKDNEDLRNTIRCMYDIIVVDYANKVIIPIDLKTTYAPENEFKNSFNKWYYDLQATMYSYILRSVVKNDEYFRDFSVEPFAFMPINKFHLSPHLHMFALNIVNQLDI